MSFVLNSHWLLIKDLFDLINLNRELSLSKFEIVSVFMFVLAFMGPGTVVTSLGSLFWSRIVVKFILLGHSIPQSFFEFMKFKNVLFGLLI